MKTKRKLTSPPAPVSTKLSASMASMLTQMELDRTHPELLMRTLSLAGPQVDFGDPQVHMFVRCTEAGIKSEEASLPLSGGAGPVRTALVPISQIDKLTSNAAVRRVSAPREL